MAVVECGCGARCVCVTYINAPPSPPGCGYVCRVCFQPICAAICQCDMWLLYVCSSSRCSFHTSSLGHKFQFVGISLGNCTRFLPPNYFSSFRFLLSFFCCLAARVQSDVARKRVAYHTRSVKSISVRLQMEEEKERERELEWEILSFYLLCRLIETALSHSN